MSRYLFPYLLILAIAQTKSLPSTESPKRGPVLGEACTVFSVNTTGICRTFEDCVGRSGRPNAATPTQPCARSDDGVPLMCCRVDAYSSTHLPPAEDQVLLAQRLLQEPLSTDRSTADNPKVDPEPEAKPASCALKPAGIRCSNLLMPSKAATSLAEKKCWEYHDYLWSSVAPSHGGESCGRRRYSCYIGTTGDRIVGSGGGIQVQPKEFPHMASLRVSGALDHVCGGTLISPHFVVTAAHCINSTSGEPSMVVLGAVTLHRNDTLEEERQEIRIKRRIVHPEFRTIFGGNDIALVELETPAVMSEFVRPACLYTGSIEGDLRRKQFIAAGWGRSNVSSDASDEMNEELLQVRLKLATAQDCKSAWNQFSLVHWSLSDKQICMGGKKIGPSRYTDTCNGDSGGPVQMGLNVLHRDCMHRVVGITSFGPPECGSRIPSIYTNVSYHIPWIEQHVWPCESSP